MTRSLGALVVVAMLASCEPETPPPPPPPNPPQVFLTLTEANVIGDAVKGRVNVSGCKTVTQVQLLQGNNNEFLYDVMYTKSPTEFTLPAGLFSALYPRVGIAASLTLRAKVVCDDGRTNNSQPVGLKFFPIERRFTALDGSQAVPDNFIAEGGFGGTPNTFLGCVQSPSGTTIARVNDKGEILPGQFIAAMPFNCTLATQISDRSNVTGTRWAFEPGQGAFAFDTSLRPVKIVLDPKATRIGVGKLSGIAAIWLDDSATTTRLRMARPVVDASNDWIAQLPLAIMNSDPQVDDGAGNSVWISMWEFNQGSKRADIVPYQYDLTTGALRNGVIQGKPAVMLTQQYPLDATSEPIIPQGVFSADGAFFTIPLISLSALTSTIVSCSTSPSSPNCEGSARRWTSPIFNGIFRLALPFSQGNMMAAVSPFGVYFLNNQLGSVINLGEVPIMPAGSQVVVGVRPGSGQDFYVLTGPNFGAGQPSYPTEIIATDAPSAGELWRLEYGSGESSANGMYLSIDEANRVWIRTGLDLIKPLPNDQYRMARGPTMIP